jgi:glycosyltransferase involved in cell wall biosynthesis
VHEKNVVLVSALVPFPPARGVELRIYRLLQWLRDAGYRVILVLTAQTIDADVLDELEKVAYRVHWTKPAFRTRLGMRFPRIRRLLWEPYKRIATPTLGAAASTPSDSTESAKVNVKNAFASDRLRSLVKSVVRRYRPSAVIVEYIFSAPVFSAVPSGTLKLLDTIDVFSRKGEQVLAFGIEDQLACSEKEERAYLLEADVVIAIQAEEAAILRELVPERQVILAGIDLDVVSSIDAAEELPNYVAVVASDNALNVHGLNAFLTECWPLIKERVPGVRLHIVGRVGDMCRIDDASIKYSGWISDLDQTYREAKVIINPTVAGTGLKIKSVQALAHGKPLVAWTNGVEGLPYVGEPPYVECESWLEFAAAVSELLRDERRRSSLVERALAYARVEFGAAKVYESLAECLAHAGASPSAEADRPNDADHKSASALR